MTKGLIDADAILNRAKPLVHQKGHEMQPFGHLVKLPIALAENVCKEGVENLNQLLADTITLRDLYKKHHWQAAGPTFEQLHLLFDKHYERQNDLVDKIAERIQVLGWVSIAMSHDVAGVPGAPYANMPAIAPIGVRVDKSLDVPAFAKGPAVDPAKGYRTQKLGDGLYMVTEDTNQSMFMTYEDGVVVVDAPQTYASRIAAAIAEVTDKPITHLVYSHFHADHIGGAKSLGGHPIIIAHVETNRLLARDNDPNRPLATVTFDHEYRLSVGSQVLELSYHGTAHAPGNIFIYAPKQKPLMVVDVLFPGWMPWRRLALAQDVPALFEQVKEISKLDFDTFVGGHVARTGTHPDVAMQLAFMEDLRAAAQAAVKSTTQGEGLNASD